MLTALCKSLTLFLLLGIARNLASGTRELQEPPQGSADSHCPEQYLPPGVRGDASLLPVVLCSLEEPSLLDSAAQDANLVSFRVSYFAPVPTHKVAVRLVVNADGSGQVTSAVSSGTTTGVKRTRGNVSKAEVDGLVQLMEKVGFWSMASIDSPEPKTDKAGRKMIEFDGAWWMLEGVKKGSFHYVFRRNPKPSPVMEIGCYLAKDLVKSDGAAIPMPGCAEHKS